MRKEGEREHARGQRAAGTAVVVGSRRRRRRRRIVGGERERISYPPRRLVEVERGMIRRYHHSGVHRVLLGSPGNRAAPPSREMTRVDNRRKVSGEEPAPREIVIA